MGQERFADIVERFAAGYRDGAAAVDPDAAGGGRKSSSARSVGPRTSRR